VASTQPLLHQAAAPAAVAARPEHQLRADRTRLQPSRRVTQAHAFGEVSSLLPLSQRLSAHLLELACEVWRTAWAPKRCSTRQLRWHSPAQPCGWLTRATTVCAAWMWPLVRLPRPVFTTELELTRRVQASSSQSRVQVSRATQTDRRRQRCSPHRREWPSVQLALSSWQARSRSCQEVQR
jgi:hypothetical protein